MTAPAPSPMLAQYFELKSGHPDTLLLFRMGDFYELFFDDALVVAAALNLTLTKRGEYDGQPVPLCGVPVHAYESYLSRLIRKGYRVAVAEQVEDPAEAKKRPGNKLVRREVIRVITPGTLTEDNLLPPDRRNLLAALVEIGGEWGLAALDITEGQPQVEVFAGAPAVLVDRLDRLQPAEILLPDRLVQRPDLFEVWGPWKAALTPLPSSRFDHENGRKRLCELYEVATLDGYGRFGKPAEAALGALMDYVLLTQKGRLPPLSPPRAIEGAGQLMMDAATRRNLEIVQSFSGERDACLLGAIDRCLTPAGSRLLAARLLSPSTDIATIDRRLDAVAWAAGDGAARADLRAALKGVPDLERLLARLSLRRGGPRDLAGVATGLGAAETLRARLLQSAGLPPALTALARDLGGHAPLIERFARALKAELPVFARDGDFVADGYLPKLDEYRQLRSQSQSHIAALQADYVTETGIASLKIKHNNILGYHIEVTSTHADKLLRGELSQRFTHRQTMAGAVRFTTPRLAELERAIAEAGERALALELEIFDQLVAEVTGRAAAIAATARALAKLDVTLGLADLAAADNWCRPEIDDSDDFAIAGGRHPVVALRLAAMGESFIANDCDLSDGERLWLVTGPNMAGKSTFLRQNALMVVLAQAGSFVPAERARIGLVDRLFSRVGAADDLARGRSTFMVEMVEAAGILNRATPRSLVILDELGRGTATYDGLSLAWACLEHLHDVNACRGLFATHYHELTLLSRRLPQLSCHTVAVKEWQGSVRFLHAVQKGTADRSYGIHVARLAGLPDIVLGRAEEILGQLEQDDKAHVIGKLVDDLPLFAAMKPKARPPAHPVAERLKVADLDALSPRDALALLYELQGMAKA